jgi:hypothetical protein
LAIIPLFQFRLWHVADRPRQLAVIEPVGPCQAGIFDSIKDSPRPALADEPRLEQADDPLGQGVVERVVGTADYKLYYTQLPFGERMLSFLAGESVQHV